MVQKLRFVMAFQHIIVLSDIIPLFSWANLLTSTYQGYLSGLKGVVIGYNFGNIYSGDSLCPNVALKISDDNYRLELERLYTYFKRNRHVIFHTDQILIGTQVLKNKNEADEIIDTVINLIESSYVNINHAMP
jgi:hypothetical protein